MSGHKLVAAIGALALLLRMSAVQAWTQSDNGATAHFQSSFHAVQTRQSERSPRFLTTGNMWERCYEVCNQVSGYGNTTSTMSIVPRVDSLCGRTLPTRQLCLIRVYEKKAVGFVYQIPVLGGTPRKIIEDVDTPITFSADGQRFAWIRQFPNSGDTALFIANADGSGERRVALRQRPERYLAGTPVGPSWSPTEDLIAARCRAREGKDFHDVSVDSFRN